MTTNTLSVDQVRADLDALGIDIAFKSAPAVVSGGAAQALSVEESGNQGRVRAIVSVTGVEDSVRDIIQPGAYTKTLKDRKPKVCWHHSWEKPIGRTESIEEWAPGDSRLPAKTKDGKPWPAKAGALVADMVFNLKSDRGREAFEAVKFYTESNECEWSIGYNVPPGASTKDRTGVRHIKSLDLYELSFVLFGAAPLSMTLDLKSADLGQIAQDWRDEQTDDEAEVKALHDAADAHIDWTQVKAAATLGEPVQVDEPGLVAAADWRPEVGRLVTRSQRKAAVEAGVALADGSYPIEDEHDLRLALAHVESKGISDESVRDHVARAALRLDRWDLVDPAGAALEGKAGAPGVADTPGDQASVARLKAWYVTGEGAARIRWGTDGDWARCVDLASKHMTPENAKGFCNLRHRDATGAAPGHAPGEKKSAHALVRAAVSSPSGTVTLTPALDAASDGAGPDGAGQGQVVEPVEAHAAGSVATLEVDGTGDRFQVRDADAQSDPAQVVYVESIGDGAVRLLPSHAVRETLPVLPVAVAAEGATGEQEAGTKVRPVLRDGADGGVRIERKVGEQGGDWVAVPGLSSVVAFAEPGAKSAGRVAAVVLDGAAAGVVAHVPTVHEEKAVEVLSADEVKAMLAEVGIDLPLPEVKAPTLETQDDDTEGADAADGAEPMIGKGAMLALPVPAEVAGGLAVQGGNPPEELHVTLAFLGDASVVQALQADPGKRQALIDVVKAAGRATAPLVGSIGGLGQFPDSGDGVPVWVPVDVPNLAEFREDVVDDLEEAGVDYSELHGFAPHITLGYGVDAAVVPTTAVTFSRLNLHLGADIIEIPFSGLGDGNDEETEEAAETPEQEGAEVEGKAAAYDPTLEVTEPEVETKAAAPMAGSYEERIREVDEALREVLVPQVMGGKDGFVSIDATFPDRVVATIYDTRGVVMEPQTYEARYVIGQDGEASIVGTPVKVELTTVVSYETAEDPAEGATEYAKALIEEAGALYRATHAQESKAGRVLSSANAKRLSGAVQSLIAILAAAGVEVENPTKGDIEAEAQIQNDQVSQWDAPPDSTSVGASRAATGAPGKKDGMEVLTAAEMKALLAEVGLDGVL